MFGTETTLGEQYTTIENLIWQLEDAVSFMELFEDEETAERKQAKEKSIEQANKYLDSLKKEMVQLDEDGASDDSYRVCTGSGEIMVEGYIINDGEAYYKDKEELLKVYTEEQSQEMYEEEILYWTTWH